MPGRSTIISKTANGISDSGELDPRAQVRSAPVLKASGLKKREEEEAAAKSQAPTAVQPVEPEDAYLTGVSRSLQRRLLGLNVNGPQGQSKPHPEAGVAGQHSTGSYTKAKSVATKESKSSKKKE